MLEHLRVIDLTDGGASLAGRILADLGAEVILVEPPQGVASRRIGPFVDDVPDPERSLEFWAMHRGKRSLVVDPTSPTARDALLALAGDADAWISDRSLAGLDDLLPPRILAAEAPRLVITEITPFGASGPKRDWPATDLTVTAASTVMDLTGDADRPPLSCSVPQAFFHAGAEAAGAVLIALEERRRSGLGQHVDVSAQTAMMASNQAAVLASGWNATPMTRTGGGVSMGPYRVRFIYACKDGYMNLTFLFGEPIGHATQRFFDWMDEEGFSNDALRAESWVAYGAKIMRGQTPVESHEAVLEAIEAFTRTKTKAELLEAAFSRRLLIVPLNDCADLVASPHLAEREFWREIRHPVVDRPILHPGPFARLGATPLDCSRPAPLLGELSTPEPRRHDADPAPTTDSGVSARASASPAPRGRPPEGLKVLDFSWVYAGPALTRTLADQGATVIKIESSTVHDALRATGPYLDDVPGPNRTANFANVNLGKWSIGLDLKQEAGREVALRLVDWADVVVENFSPKAMAGFGLDWPTLRERKPSLVMLSSSLAGQTGPHRMLAGYGTMGSALAGFGTVTGWPDRHPSAPYVAYTDYVSPRFGLAALLAALDHARRTGEGQHVDLSQAEASIHFLGAALLDYTANGRVPGARGNAHPHYAPSGVYPVAGRDRWIAISAPDDACFARLAGLAARGWLENPRFATAEARRAHAEALDAEIADWTRPRPGADLEARLVAADVPAHRVYDSHDAFEDPQLAARGHFVPIGYADLGPVPFEGARALLSATPAQPGPCPTLGEHNQTILSELLGLDDDTITELVIAGVIQ
jgi:crotonobetainyl-CoA:carnitine CoA-transferase CaiB-like acyl-CoA transferase